ncbi:DUF11 domain-containing protein [Clostridium felsineum]|uniref:Uncharacterized protein n=1 Tax=Clostridium felsineum TaxID=36839 RepID=A0A1S8KXY5_9CLOT|nr:DUF11 domain-containing protein [Clostridium felsineum]MCR3760181.1 DUF11 domain-containing protein [Clostridium felsineum]URZ05577.1 hypothetical protein CLROS_009030 [Clostridium felsineum]URZ10616.1 hypothetical protein CROST_013260 [Clostridium felsineum]
MARTIPNTANAKGTNTNDATDTFSITAGNPITNLSLTKTGPATVVVGVPFDYTISITNNDATETALSVAFTDNHPNGVVFNTVSSSAGLVSINGTGDAVGNLGDIAPGITVTVTINATVTP